MAAAYAEAHISPTLGPALAALCRAKPADPVTWLAHYLLEHKPAKKLVAAGTAAAMKSFVDAFESEEGKAELKKLFMSIDTDGSGSVTSKEWGKAIGQHWKEMGKFFGGLSMGEVGKMFKKLDADGSGDLTWDEFENALQQLDMKAGHDKEPNHGGQQMLRPQRVSSQWRTNPTLESFAQPLRLTERSKEQLENLWRVLNKKKDDRIDYDDFVGLADHDQDLVVARRRWQEMSTHFDSDGNGHITPIEFIEGFKALVLRRPLDLEGSFRSVPRTHAEFQRH